MDAKGYPNVLLLIGAAGTGKSTIATTVSGKYQRRRQLGCHMFFLRERSHPESVLQSIAYSLSVFSQTIAECLVNQLKDSGDLGPSNLKTKFDILLRDTLYTADIKEQEPILVVLDALDECGTPEARRGLIDVLQDRLPTLPPNFRFLITSRPEKDILTFTSLPSSRVQILNLDHQMDENRLDVFTYIKHELEEPRSLETLCIPRGWSWKEESIECLADIADGLSNRALTTVKHNKVKQSDQFPSLLDVASKGKVLE